MRLEDTRYSPHWFRRNFKKHFPGHDPAGFIDLVYVQLNKECRLDVIKFDDLMHKLHGEYEEICGYNLKEVVQRFHGKEASRWVESAL